MSSPQTSAAMYYLAIDGEQIGPISEEDVLNRIQNGQINKETLVWSEGMSEWAPLPALAVFESALINKVAHRDASAFPIQEEVAQEKPVQSAPPKVEKKKVEINENELEPVFGNAAEENAGFVKERIVSISLGLGVLAAATLGYFYFASSENSSPQKKLSVTKAQIQHSRQMRLSKAQSEILTHSEISIADLRKLINENPNDDIAKQAAGSLIDHFRGTQRYVEAAKILMQTKQFAEAAKMFSTDSNHKRDAEEAYYQAFQTTAEVSSRRTYLKESIALLLGPLSNSDRATERIRLYLSTFPNEPHPYGYYLQSTDERIADIFSRISFHFVQSLLAYFETELSQITLLSRPLVEIKKSRANEYRIVGSYKGEVLLNKDRMKRIYFTFWMDGDRWVLVDTNITLERKRWSEKERLKLINATVSGETMLKQLEQVFRTQFPQNALHEKVSRQTEVVKTKKDDFQ